MSEYSEKYYLSTLALLCTTEDIASDIHELDQQLLYKLTVFHGLNGLIDEKYMPIPTSSHLFFRQVKQYNAHANIAFNFKEAAINKQLKLLYHNDVPFVILKGHALANSIYPKPYLRPKADVDILIDANYTNRVIELFEENGFFNPRGWTPKFIVKQFSQRKIVSEGLNVDFDVHLKISNNPVLQDVLQLPTLIQTAEFNENCSALVISKHDALVHAVFHLLHHRYMGDTIKLIWFYDIYLLINCMENKTLSRFISEVERYGLSEITIFVLNLTAEYFNSHKLQDTINHLKPLQGNPKLQFLTSRPSKLILLHKVFSSEKTLPNKFALFMEMAFPPKQEIYNKYGKAASSPLFWLYIRRFCGAFKKMFTKP